MLSHCGPGNNHLLVAWLMVAYLSLVTWCSLLCWSCKVPYSHNPCIYIYIYLKIELQWGILNNIWITGSRLMLLPINSKQLANQSHTKNLVLKKTNG